MSRAWPSEGVVYTETVVHTPPERYASEAPYQIAVIEVSDGRRITVRIASRSDGERAQIGDVARFLEERGGAPYYSLLESVDSSNK